MGADGLQHCIANTPGDPQLFRKCNTTGARTPVPIVIKVSPLAYGFVKKSGTDSRACVAAIVFQVLGERRLSQSPIFSQTLTRAVL
jgi:hypothetical protein